MSADWKKDHIPISPEKIQHSPKRSGKPFFIIMGEEQNYDELGENLLADLNTSVKYCRRPEKLFEEDYLFIVRTKNPIAYELDLLEKCGMTLSIQRDEYSAIVVLQEAELREFEQKLKTFSESKRFRTYFKKFVSISPVYFDRISPELSEWLTVSEFPKEIEIELLPNLNRERYALLVSKLRNFLEECGDEFLSGRIREESAYIRGNIKPKTIEAVVQGLDSIWQTRSSPTIILEQPQNLGLDQNIDEIDIIPPSPTAKNICVLDTGVDTNNPFLEHIVIETDDFSNSGSNIDNHGHGTFVAGLAAYGNFEQVTHNATANIISAKIHKVNGKNIVPLEDLIEQAVIKFHKKAKIFSLSILYPRCSDVDSPSILAHTLDRLSAEYDVLFVVCTGNIKEGLDVLVDSLPYPDYFSNTCCKLFSGSESCNSITVGGLAKNDSPLSVAKKGQPSPFTRRGNFSTRFKPDVVSWAGNLEKDVNSKTELKPRKELSVISLARNPRLYGFDNGTSFSTPMISNIVARLLEKYPFSSKNLLKALVLHFASLPAEHSSLTVDDGLKKSLYGKGIPNFETCAFSSANCATYIAEDSIKFDQKAWIPIYVPERMKEIFGAKILRVTLVYDPPFDRGIEGYTLANLTLRLHKNDGNVSTVQRKWENKFMNPWDNVKTGVFRWQKGGWGEEWKLEVTPNTRFKERIDKPEQDFAVVITLEDPSKKVDIYSAINNELRKPIETLVPYFKTQSVSVNSTK